MANALLSRLSDDDYKLLQPDLEPIDMPARRELVRQAKPVHYIYFPEGGIASVVADGSAKPIEVGIVGRDGMTSVGVILGRETSDHDVFVQIASVGHRMKREAIVTAFDQSPTLRRHLLSYVYSFLLQVTHTALANGREKVEDRLARWLLLAQDRVGDDIKLTHELLALMLGTPRPSVTRALDVLVENKLVQNGRGIVRVIDRRGLLARCEGTYNPVE